MARPCSLALKGRCSNSLKPQKQSCYRSSIGEITVSQGGMRLCSHLVPEHYCLGIGHKIETHAHRESVPTSVPEYKVGHGHRPRILACILAKRVHSH